VHITVILCTYNRSPNLTKALVSVLASKLGPGVEWEVLVVDNNSSDRTRDVVEECIQQNPRRVRYLFEPRPGKSHALNAGIRNARGDILAFMDDDVIVQSTWLQNLTASLQHGGWAGAGGRVLPLWNGDRPSWLCADDRHVSAPLVTFELCLPEGRISEPPFGTSMAFRKEMFEKYGGFRTDLGPRPGSQIRSEDTEFGRRLLNAGEPVRYEPSAVVYHPVPEDRLRKEYFLEWWFDKGRGDIRESGVRPNAKYFLAGIPLYLFRNIAVWTIRWVITFNPSRRFIYKMVVWGKAGEVVECRQRARNR
jgi:glucosyl-dolichyl phosphate glucuronosyltransferase